MDSLMKSLFKTKFEVGDCLKAMCFINKNILKELWMLRKDVVMVKLLGKTFSFCVMQDRL